MKHSKKKRRRQQPSKQAGNISVENSNGGEMEKEKIIISSLVEAFSLASVEEAKAAYDEANGDANKAAEILSGLSSLSSDNNSEIFNGLSDNSSEAFRSSCSSSTQSVGLDSSSSDGFNDSNGASDDLNNDRGFRGNRGKKVVAATGIVSTVLGKDYVSSTPKKELLKQKGIHGTKVNIEEAEQFLCSMLGNDCDLGMGVVKDVLCSCGYNVEKALEVLLDLSAASCEQSRNDSYSSYNANNGDDTKVMTFIDDFWQLTDKGYDLTSHSSKSEVQDNLLNMTCRNYAEVLVSSKSSHKLAAASLKTEGPELPQQVLESLFNIPKRSEREPETMNWRNVVKQMESFAQKRVGLCPPGNAAPELNNLAKGAEYQVFRESAREQWDKMKTCYQKAAAAYSGGEKNYASYMSEKGKLYSKMAREADEKASMEIFKARNKDIENVLTIDLHGQHVKPAMRLVKLHLLFGTYISSVQYLRIITGCGSHGVGKSKLKQSVVSLLEKEKIEWREENQGTVLIRLGGAREFSFLDSGSDSDSG